MNATDRRIHVVHVLNRLGIGGMENVVVQLINGLPADRFRHSVIAITEVQAEVAARIRVEGVGLYALGKTPGQPFWRYPRMYRLLRQLKPDVWHSCNLAALEFAPVAWLAGVPCRVHAEHGLEMDELRGRQPAYRWLRRLYRDCVHRYVAVSEPIAAYLRERIGIAPQQLSLIGNGVDLTLFRPLRADDPALAGYPFETGQHWVVGTVGRQEKIKNPMLLVEAFIRLVNAGGPQSSSLRLAMVGEGSLHAAIRQRMEAAGMAERLWLPGNRGDIADLLRRLDCFVLPSISEGTSCTLQEAIASGVRVIATDVGGNRSVLDDGRIGRLVASEDIEAMLAALAEARQGFDQAESGRMRQCAESRHDLATTIRAYGQLFSGVAATNE